MTNNIVITINLLGRINGSVSHTETQAVLDDSRKKVTILHNDRGDQSCYKRTSIHSSIVQQWVFGPVPFFSTARDWKRLNQTQRIKAYVDRFDEGFGVSYELV